MSPVAHHPVLLRWLTHLPLAVLPFLAAAAVEGPLLSSRLTAEVEARLAAEGQGWAKVAADGRDVAIRGTAPGKHEADAALAIAKSTFGVRRAELHVLLLGGG